MHVSPRIHCDVAWGTSSLHFDDAECWFRLPMLEILEVWYRTIGLGIQYVQSALLFLLFRRSAEIVIMIR